MNENETWVRGNLVMTPLAGVGEGMRTDPKQKYLI